MKDTRTLRERYDDVRARVAAAAERSGRRPSDIMLVAVTKYASIEEIRELVSYGQIDLGENRVQQMVQRAAMIDEFNARRHERASTADDVAQIAAGLGYEFSGDELLRASGQKIGRVTITKQDVPGEYN